MNPHENTTDPGDEDDGRTFDCACGDPKCIGHYNDTENVRIGKAWYAESCLMVTTKLAVIDALGYGEWE
jgi:hypothetical protein